MRGFSLVEVLVAAGILASGVLALAVLLARSVPLTISAGDATRAAVAGAGTLEYVRSAPGVDPALEYLDAGGRILPAASGVPGGAFFVRRSHAIPLPGHASAEIVTVVVSRVGGRVSDGASIVGVRGAP